MREEEDNSGKRKKENKTTLKQGGGGKGTPTIETPICSFLQSLAAAIFLLVNWTIGWVCEEMQKMAAEVDVLARSRCASVLYMPLFGFVQARSWFRSSMRISSVAGISKILCTSEIASATFLVALQSLK